MKPPKTLKHEFVEFIPDVIEEGKIYVRNMTFAAKAPHDPLDDVFDEPIRSQSITNERFKQLVEKKDDE